MTKDIDLDALQALAEKAPHIDTDLLGDRYFSGDYSCATLTKEQDDFVRAANQQTILSLIARIRELEGDAGKSADAWQDMATAPKGGGAELVTDPKWVDPPRILLLFKGGKTSIGYWDWYYAEGGAGYAGGTAWIEPCSGERLDLHYGAPIGWMPAPSAGRAAPEGGKEGGE